MEINNKLNDKLSEMENFKLYCNKLVKHIKVNMTEEKIGEYELTDLFKTAQRSLGLEDVFSLTGEEWIFVKELLTRIINDDWKPKQPIDIQEYLDIRKKLVLPILEEGTMEYKLLDRIYDTICMDAVCEITLLLSNIFIYKELDYKELEQAD